MRRTAVYGKPLRTPMPRLLKSGLIALSVLLAGILAARAGLSAYLQARAALRQSAHTQTLAAHPLSYREPIERYAADQNLQPAFIAAVIMAESSYRKDARSGADARGLMQIKPDTGRWIAEKLGENDSFTPERLYDPETNIRYGAWYLGYLSRLFLGDPVWVTAAYHAGQTTVMNWIAAGMSGYEAIPDGPTKNYVRRVTTAYGIYERLYFAPPTEIGAVASQP